MAEYRRQEAVCHGSLGLVLDELNKTDEAYRQQRAALAIRQDLANAEPGDIRSQNDLARTHMNIGKIYRRIGKPEEALAEWDQALAISQPLLKRPISKEDGRRELSRRSSLAAILREDLAELQVNRASTLREKSRLDAAGAASRQASDLLEELLRDQPGNLSFRALRGDAYSEEDLFAFVRDKLEEAQESLRGAIATFEGLFAANPQVALYHSMLAQQHLQLGWTLVRLGRRAEAQAALHRTIELAESLLAEDPNSPAYRTLLSQGLTQGGNLLVKDGQAAIALPMFQRALQL